MGARGSRIAMMLMGALALAACARGGGSGSSGASTPGSGAISTAEVAGVGTVLVDAEGFTLYAFMPDQAGKPTCTGGCAGTWPPLIVTQVPEGTGLPGTFDTVASPAGGKQLTYDGWPLYRYSGDGKPGEANGQGIGGVWFAMTPDGPSGGAAAGGASGSGNTGGGYGYGNGGGGRYGP